MPDGPSTAQVLKTKFGKIGRTVRIPLQNGREFKATMTEEGIEVDNLGRQPQLPWEVFEAAVWLLRQQGGRAKKGNAMSFKLGEEGLSMESVEGHVAHVVYRKYAGDSVFRRITPIAAILVWSGLCENAPGELVLR